MTAKLAAALVAAQAELKPVDKTGKSHHGTYVTLDHLIAETRDALRNNGLTIVQLPAASDLGQPLLRTIILHDSGESITADAPLFLPNQDMQKLGAAITYMRRYAWAAALGIASEDDDDGNRASAPAKKKDSARHPSGASNAEGAAASPVAAAPELPELANENHLKTLGQEWKRLKPDWNEQELAVWIEKNRTADNYGRKLTTAIATYTNNIAKEKAAR